ncbi:MAG: hypothetical protein HQK49_14485 [Oligoflexia bacterium]|nr:hypothetical protein [Oligoflexia bacterium]
MKIFFYSFCLIIFLSYFLDSNVHASAPLIKMSYVEVNSNNLSNVGCYLRSDNLKPFIQITSIFAANINGNNPEKPEIYFNPQVTKLLNSDYQQITFLQKKGIKVLITLLGNHQNAGWSCMTNTESKKKFAQNIVNMVNKYNLDGVDIDDEYSTCVTNESSIADIAQYIKENPSFKGKLLTKALFSDYFAFSNLKLAKYLDYGWEMSYFSDNFEQRLNPYLLQYKVKKEKLFLGGSASAGESYPSPSNITKYVSNNNFAGVMIYNITTNSQNYLNQIAQAEYEAKTKTKTKNKIKRINVIVTQNCLNISL